MSKYARRLEEARLLHEKGDAAGAAKVYAALRREAPNDAVVLHGLGVALAQDGRLDEAEGHLTRAVALMPKDPSLQFDLGVLFDARQRFSEAEAAFRRVVELDPNHAPAWEALGLVRRSAGDLAGSADAYRRAAGRDPRRIDHVLNAAEPLEPSAGADLLIDALNRFPGEERLLLPLAELLIRADRLEEAEATLGALHRLHPEMAVVSRHLGAVLARLGRIPDAIAALSNAIVRSPDDPETWSLLAQARDAMGDPDGAVAAAERAVFLGSNDADLVGTRARLQQHAGRVENAQAGLSALPFLIREKAETRLLQGMLMPPILDSVAQIDALRERWMETMADVEARPTPIAEPWNSVGLTGYYLEYQGREDRPLMEAYARASLASSPHLAYESPNVGSGSGRIRVGFLSAYMRNHSVGRVLIDLMGSLDRSRFEVLLFQLPDKRHAGQERAETAADRTIRLVPRLDEARRAVEAERLDALIFCDLHLNPFADALTHSRLAPVQATTWGHPGTSGRTTLDYWLSYEDWEPEGNERLYTERLVRLAHPPFVTPRPPMPELARDRRALGLEEDARLYACLQSLFKIHPEYDPILSGILEGDPKARIVFIAGPHYTWQERLRERFARTFDASRVDFLPKLAHKDYLSAVAACDVSIDPIHFGGANTTYDAFLMGMPVVTLPGDQMRNRPTYGFYRQMGYLDLIADTPERYVELAHRVAQDEAFAREARERILATHDVLFENRTPVADFEAWLGEAVQGKRA